MDYQWGENYDKSITKAKKEQGQEKHQEMVGRHLATKIEFQKKTEDKTDALRRKKRMRKVNRVLTSRLSWLGWLVAWLVGSAVQCDAWSAIKPSLSGPPAVPLLSDECHGNARLLPVLPAAAESSQLLANIARSADKQRIWAQVDVFSELDTTKVVTALCVVLFQSWYMFFLNKAY